MISNRVSRIQPSFTLEMTARAADLRNQGKNVIDLGVGEPDFNTPKHIREAAKKAMDDGFTKYTPVSGMLELRRAICDKLERDNGLKFSPEQVIASNGAKHSLSTACQALFNPGDEVIIFSPYWVSFPEFVRLADAEPVIIQTMQERNFTPDFDELESKITSNIKGVILNSPSNPTGAVWDDETIKRILNYAAENNWVVISDECYEQLVYDQSFTSTEFLNDGDVQVLTIQSLSKTYAMTGWRIGYCAGDVEIIKAMGKIQGQATSCPNSIGQKAAIEALMGDQSTVKKILEIFSHRRNKMLERLNKIPDVTCTYPGGAFYAFPDVSSYIGLSGNGKKISSSFDLSDYILDCARTVTVAGSGFGRDGHIRLSYATNEETFLEGLDRIETVLNKLS
ncbi:MAG: pyridoxal phosphate-dependent aminotransferase [Candidatus Marinimicrobia bacterium]|nr:pyridoxal phosphate-dependent aminotransferase [Candidatus Neomarinimicrobiota bacterium]